MIKLSRAQIGKFKGNNGLDITVKNATGWSAELAPTWELVLEHKRHIIDDDIYRARYNSIIFESVPKVLENLLAFGKEHGDTITFLCYCKDGAFCHTVELIHMLVDNYPDQFSTDLVRKK